MRCIHEEVSVKSDCIKYDAIIFPNMNKKKRKGFDRPISAENTQFSRMSRHYRSL